jgi:hypothetical protein
VRQLARLSEAGVERLAWLPGPFLLAPIRFEQVSATVGEDDSAVVRAEWRHVQQTLAFEVVLGSARVLPTVVKIAFGHDAKGADGGEHPGFRAVDLVHTITFPYWPALTTARQVEILGEHLPRAALMIAVAFTWTASTAEVALPRIVMIAMMLSNVVPIPHFPPLDFRAEPRASIPSGLLAEYEQAHKSAASNRRLSPVRVGWCRSSGPKFDLFDPAVWLTVSISSVVERGMVTHDPIREAKAATARGDYESAITVLRPLAEAGNRDGQYQLGFLALTECELISGREGLLVVHEGRPRWSCGGDVPSRDISGLHQRSVQIAIVEERKLAVVAAGR